MLAVVKPTAHAVATIPEEVIVNPDEVLAEALWGALTGAVPVLGAISNGLVASHLVHDAGGGEDVANVAFAVGAITNLACTGLSILTLNPFSMLPSAALGAVLFASAASRGL